MIAFSKTPPETDRQLWRDESGNWRRFIDGQWTEDEEANSIAKLERRLEKDRVDEILLDLLYHRGIGKGDT